MKKLFVLILFFQTQSWGEYHRTGQLFEGSPKCHQEVQIQVPKLNQEWSDYQNRMNSVVVYEGDDKFSLGSWSCGAPDAKGSDVRACKFILRWHCFNGRRFTLKGPMKDPVYNEFELRTYYGECDSVVPSPPDLVCRYRLAEPIPVPKEIYCVPGDYNCNEFRKKQIGSGE